MMTDSQNTPSTIGELFSERPAQWGLRGDMELWNELEQHFRYFYY